ncbi:zinc finger, C2H2-type domain containing protein [Pseudohyphozyma bogoriensis]|nr:zinc finger, C2H2-type domain containing protein [Pseudohyphozyma bogoriensis]
MPNFIQLFLSPRPPRTVTKDATPFVFCGGGCSAEWDEPGNTMTVVHYVSHPSCQGGRKALCAPPPHIHLTQSEIFTVHSGIMGADMGGQYVELRPEDGEYDAVPRVAHSFWPVVEGGDFRVSVRPEPGTGELGAGFDEKFFRNFQSYLDDCAKHKVSPSLPQLVLLLWSGGVVLALPLPFAIIKRLSCHERKAQDRTRPSPHPYAEEDVPPSLYVDNLSLLSLDSAHPYSYGGTMSSVFADESDNPFAKQALAYPLSPHHHQNRKPQADFELFGPADDFLAPLPVPWDLHSPPSGDPNDPRHAHALDHFSPNHAGAPPPDDLPVPDLVPDSPSSPSLAYLPRPELRDPPRSSSAPIPAAAAAAAAPRLRQLQGLPGQAYPSATSSPFTASHLPYQPSTHLPASHAGGLVGGGMPASSAHLMASSSGVPASSSSYGAQSSAMHNLWSQPPSMHPVLSVNQQDLLSRVHRMQPNPSPSHQPQAYKPPPSYLSLPLTQSSPQAQEFRKTVSPQEAFLDYQDVDHALHMNPHYNSSFGVGVGTGTRGASLFAPLPSPVHYQQFQREESPRPHSPASTSALASPPPSASLRSSSLPPAGNLGAMAGKTIGGRHGSSRFSVPKNAVSWEDQQDESGGDEEDDEGEDDSADHVAAGTTGGKTNAQGVVIGGSQEQRISSTAPAPTGQIQYSGKRLPNQQYPPQLQHPRPVDFRQPDHFAHLASQQPHTNTHLVSSPRPHLQQTRPSSVHPPTPPVHAAQASAPSTASAASDSTQGQQPPSPPAPASPDTKRTTRGVKLPSMKVDLGDDEDDESDRPAKRRAASESGSEDEEDSDEYVPAEDQPQQGSSSRRSGGRKRSRTPVAESEDSDEFDEDDDDEEEFEKPARTSGKKRGATTQTPNKRRRRAPPAQSTANMTATSIRCPHVYPDGASCGVIFRRPYDLARHRETIHGEGGKAKKEWVCEECHGSFSRKDALIRHSRIRNHNSGV